MHLGPKVFISHYDCALSLEKNMEMYENISKSITCKKALKSHSSDSLLLCLASWQFRSDDPWCMLAMTWGSLL